VERPVPASSRGARLRATLAGDGRPGPIEERIGRRLVRLVDPSSDEGRALLRSRCVELVGPEGDFLGCLSIEEASRVLRERLERRLADPAADSAALREGLSRLAAWSDRLGRS
jgi:hypothetical protein